MRDKAQLALPRQRGAAWAGGARSVGGSVNFPASRGYRAPASNRGARDRGGADILALQCEGMRACAGATNRSGFFLNRNASRARAWAPQDEGCGYEKC